MFHSVKVKKYKKISTMSKAHYFKQLLEKHGDITLQELLEKIQGNKTHECPKCSGSGTRWKEGQRRWTEYGESYDYNLYECYFCNGDGYLEEAPEPIMVQDGWEPASK